MQTGRQALLGALARLPCWPAARDVPYRGGPRIAVIGNCQARGVARSLEVLLPEAAVTLVPTGQISRRARTLRAFADGLARYDHVFSQPIAAGHFPDGGLAELLSLLPRARLFPPIVFAAFHPDMVYVGDLSAGGAAGLVPSPLHTYHSAITLFGYLRGLSEERILRLFRDDVLARLGFLDGWDLAADDLVETSRSIGFDLAPDLLRWSRRGAFMHGINHPKLFVMADIALRLATEAGLDPAPLPVEAYLADDLLGEVIWPVYPAVAEAYGLKGSYVFKRRAMPKAPPSVLDLAGLVRESLALYRTMPRARLTCQRTEHWSRSPETCALFDAA
nr:WcbI family polysaccharide biosynthesis putative acetyltransferase [Methylobacterium brachythecii]